MFGERLSLGGMAPAVLGLITTLGPGMAIISTCGWSGTIRFNLVTVGFFEVAGSALSAFYASLGRYFAGSALSAFYASLGRYFERKPCSSATSSLDEFFSKSRKFRKSSLITGCRYIHSPGSWLVVPGKHRRGLR